MISIRLVRLVRLIRLIRLIRLVALLSPLSLFSSSPALAAADGEAKACERTLIAKVVALDQPFFFNRLGAHQPGGMIYALERDVVSTSGSKPLQVGKVALRADKRPRPLVLRANVGDCLEIHFWNLLHEKPSWDQPATRWSGLHIVGLSLVRASDEKGKELDAIQADGSWVGSNPPSLVPPGGRISYVYRADQPGSYLLHSTAGNFGFEDEPDTMNLQFPSGQITAGMFGAVNVQPRGAVWFRSQVNRDDLKAATTGRTPLGQPIIDYYAKKTGDGTPVLAMLDGDEIIYSDLTAIVAYQDPDDPEAQPGEFPDRPGDPNFFKVAASPERTQPYREITAIYHQAFSTVQAFDCVYAPPFNPETGKRDYSLCAEKYARKMSDYLYDALGVAEDRYAINYASGGIGSEILANRFEVGPAGECTACKYEEFFLSSWPNGDPGQVVTLPTAAASALELPLNTLQKVLYPDDPSNVYHSYMRDHVKYRVLQSAANFHHVHHMHAHQWLRTPNADRSHYLDSQAIAPGTSFTMEMVYNGSGNRNETVGDSIFHCHFYPHFAEGMWALWRVHDVFEEGTELADDGLPKRAEWKDKPDGGRRLTEPGGRALPDGEIARGTPIPAIVPLPSRPMPPMPATVSLTADGRTAVTLVQDGDDWTILGDKDIPDKRDYTKQTLVKNPGYPFFIPGLAGQRAPRPPLDVARVTIKKVAGRVRLTAAAQGDVDTVVVVLDGGLPRSIITGSGEPVGKDGKRIGPGTIESHTRLDFSKILQKVEAKELPEDGVPEEKLAMLAHSIAETPSCAPDGKCDDEVSGFKNGVDLKFRLNGMPEIAGAPYADPCGRDDGAIFRNGRVVTRHYRGANIQIDAVFNKEGWHFPQQRIITLWDDVEPTLKGTRPPEPFFFRANSNECIEYWQTNLVPSEYALDDFQVRTPTDVLGQHIHLVKFDVTSSDGGANGYNYEDGSLAPDEVRERIEAINAAGGIRGLDGKRHFLTAEEHPRFGPGPRGEWVGAMTTVQRWMADPLLDSDGDDRTMRTVFTHDHFSPSTHQQAGLYAGLLIEPKGSLWIDSRTGSEMGGQYIGGDQDGEQLALRDDGGPTSWRANIETPKPELSFREFALEFQDMALAYRQGSIAYPDPLSFGAALPSDPSSSDDLPASEIGLPPVGDSPVAPWPQAISSGPTIGTYTVNYRNEPLSARLADREGNAPPATADVSENQDYSHVFRSIPRLRPEQNRQPPWYPPLTGGVGPTDPYTPLLEAYEGDRVQVRTLVGAHEVVHHFSLRGLSWLAEPSYLDSGYRNHQVMGISEHFELQFTLPPNPEGEDADYLYLTDSSLMGTSRGSWGILRSYDQSEEKPFLEPLPNNRIGGSRQSLSESGYCSPESRDPDGKHYQKYTVLAIAAENFVEGKITYSEAASIKVAIKDDTGKIKEIRDVKSAITSPEGLVYVNADDVQFDEEKGKWRWNEGRSFEPLVLRAAAGDCIEVELQNHFDLADSAFNLDEPHRRCSKEEYQALRSHPDDFIAGFKADNRCYGGNKASAWAGLYPQLVAFDPLHSSGYNVGRNPVQIAAAPGSKAGATKRTYYWYAGKVGWDTSGNATWTPVEFGSANLLAADPIHQHSKGLSGALVIEPEGSIWISDPNTHMSATVRLKDGSEFREFVMIIQDDLELYWNNPAAPDGSEIPLVSAEAEASVNYSTGYLLFRLAPPAPWSVAVKPDASMSIFDQGSVDQTRILASQFQGGDPATPVFTAHAGTPMRFRVLHPAGIFEGHVFTLHGHGWPDRPYTHEPNPANPNDDPYRAIAQRIGPNPRAEWRGQQLGVGPAAHFDFVIDSAGGTQHVPGDYLYRSFPAVFLEGGFWGILRVGPELAEGEPPRDIIAITTANAKGRRVTLTGSNSPILGTGDSASQVTDDSASRLAGGFADEVTIYPGGVDPSTGDCTGTAVGGNVEFTKTTGPMREWTWTGKLSGTHACASSSGGGRAEALIYAKHRFLRKLANFFHRGH